MPSKKKTPITIQDLFPNLSPEEQKLAEENLRRYVEIVVQIEQRLEREGKLDDLNLDHPDSQEPI